MNTPNKFTILRIILSPVFIALFLVENIYFRLGALVVFLVAAISDLADGYYARKYGVITGFGKFMDPLADKILVSSALVSFVALGYAPGWAVAVIIAREFLITGLRSLAAYRGMIISPTYWAKVKTFLQMVSVGVILLYINLFTISQHTGKNLTVISPATAHTAFEYLLGLTALITAATGVEYFVKYYSLLRTALR